MIFYYMLVAVVDVFTAVNEDDWQIAADIREGNISQFLLKPMDYLGYRLCLFFSGRMAFICHGDRAAGGFHFLLSGLFCRPGQRGGARGFSRFTGADGVAAIFHLLCHGDAGVLVAGDFHVHFHPVCV